jgi:hypothetical protein
VLYVGERFALSRLRALKPIFNGKSFKQWEARLKPSTGLLGELAVDMVFGSLARTDGTGVFRAVDHASFLGDKVQFALDATLGMVTIDQNNILKIFSVVTVFLLPPSVIAGFYGMNFEHIPWLHDSWGWYAALGMMLASALLPYLWFKRKGWL